MKKAIGLNKGLKCLVEKPNFSLLLDQTDMSLRCLMKACSGLSEYLVVVVVLMTGFKWAST